MSFQSRVARLAEWLKTEGTGAALFVDVEGRRDLSIRYLTGHPADALLLVLSNGKSILIPWDVNLARRIATAAEILPYTDYNRSLTTAVGEIAKSEKLEGPVEVSAATPHPVFEELQTQIDGCRFICRKSGLDEVVGDYRMVKDGDEIRSIERAADVTNELLELLEGFLTKSDSVSEVDLALFREREASRRGFEAMSCESLVAGSARSFGIHACPAYTSAPFADRGMSILGLGVLVDGYPSDVTVTIVKGKPSAKQEEMIRLVEEAYEAAVAAAAPGVETRELAALVDRRFAEHHYSMPHSLGHGLGLEVHEKPYLRNKPEVKTRLEAGMVFTIEPGLYDAEAGGVRLENDLLVTPAGTRVLTTSRILRIR